MIFKKTISAVIARALLSLPVSLAVAAQTAAPAPPMQQTTPRAVHSHRPVVRDEGSTTPTLCASCVRDNLTYLAGPELHGRGSGTEDEHHAAQFIAGKLKAYGLAPAAGDGQFIQTATVRAREVIGNPTLTVEAKANGNAQGPLVLTHGKQIVMSGLSQSPVSAVLQKLDLTDEKASPADVVSGAAVLVKLKPGTNMEEARSVLEPYRSSSASLVIIATSPSAQKMFDMLAKRPPQMPQQIGNQEPKARAALVLAKQETFDRLWSEPEGATVTLQAQITPWETSHTWNVLARIDGTEQDQIILLSAHLDHLGVENGETYYGADDDASGTAAVMELARVLAKEPKPKRTIIVALWGSEEEGMLGSRYFLHHPTLPLKDIVANLEFEMIGRPDSKLKPDELWLSGFDRTDLGPELAQHGAKLVADPHTAEKFFTRSDNYALAKDGIIAQTVSSFGLHKDYHQPTDTVDKIDFQHMDRAIASMIGPVTWLANTDFTPEWVEGKKP